MRIALLVEGRTEKAFVAHLRDFLRPRLPGSMPRLDVVPYDGRLPKGDRLRRDVERLLTDRRNPAGAVVALTDVYTGTGEFLDAADAKAKMRAWVGEIAEFYPHAAQHDFEAWLLPYWDVIRRLAGSNRAPPGQAPEHIDHDNPPSRLLREVFRTGSKPKCYVKPRDATRILRGQDLTIAIGQCPELRAFVNRILALCGGETV